MISITSAPEAPAPRIRILDTRSREVETVRIGDKLTFRIEIPEDSECMANLNPTSFAQIWDPLIPIALCFSSLRNIRQELCRHGKGFQEHLSSHR